MNEQMKEFLKEYNGQSSFVQSLRNQYLYKGYLSERQVECLQKMMEPRVYSVKVGEKLLLSKSVSTRISESLGADFVHRGFEVLGVHAETERAVLVDVKFTATRTIACCVCGITLKNDISRSIGIGPVCAEKHGIPYELNAIGLLQSKLDAVERTAHKTWIPKWAIKEVEAVQ